MRCMAGFPTFRLSVCLWTKYLKNIQPINISHFFVESFSLTQGGNHSILTREQNHPGVRVCVCVCGGGGGEGGPKIGPNAYIRDGTIFLSD